MLTDQIIDAVIRTALQEDSPWGDLTGELFLPAEARATARLAAREPGVFSGGRVFAAAMRATADGAVHAAGGMHVELALEDGAEFAAGATLGTVTGPARAILRAERIALNLVQRMSGIATLTARYVAATEGTAAHITDTRKTTPGLRALERHAVVCGGGRNHRFSLSDAVMAKDNHLAVLTAGGMDLTDAIRAVHRRLGHTTHLEVEVDRIDQIEPVVAGGVDTIMLDNFTPAELRRGVAIVAGRAIVEASGNVNLDTVAEIAATGVDVISVGALTHSARSLDLGLDVEIGAESALAERAGAER